MNKTDFYSDNPIDYIRVALAIETLAYQNKNYLNNNLTDNSKISEEVQSLLTEAIKLLENKNISKNTCKLATISLESYPSEDLKNLRNINTTDIETARAIDKILKQRGEI